MRTRRNGLTIEHPEHRVVQPRFATDFHQVPVGPYRGQVLMRRHSIADAAFEIHDTLASVMQAITAMLPPFDGTTLFVMDETYTAVFGYSSDPDITAVANGQICWYGVRAAYEWLENCGEFDMMDLAVWEGRAMETAEALADLRGER